LPTPSKIAVISYRAIGARVRTLRQEKDLTQTQLAKVLGTRQTAVSEIERGNRGLTVQQLVKLARALKTTPDAILGEENGHQPRPKSAKILRRLHRIEQLPETQQDAVLKVIDGVIKAHRIAR
jgi:transcriptional regulator with XRE-family HTH domain